jgi:myo-inositol-1(or 4)-monophosphatase
MSSRERTVALDLARAAGAMLREELGRTRQVALKGSPINLVTEMDRRSERLIVDGLRREFPDDAILAEEGGPIAGRSGRRWIVDPLDGTTNYAHGVPIFAVSLALEAAGRVVLGVIHDPNQRETFLAERGRGASLDGAPLAVSTTRTLNESLLVTGFPYDIRERRETNLREYAAFSLRSRGVRRLGSAVLDFAYVAAGRIDGYWELRVGTWDAAAGSLLVEEAGGRVTDLDGNPLDLAAPRIVATNGLIHEELLEALRDVRATRPAAS